MASFIKSNNKLFSAMLGHSLEFYDFTLYIFLLPILSTLYFPNENQIVSQLYGLTAFALSFLMRPLGAIYFGQLGDKKGRKHALSLSIILMAIPTLIISILPGYHQIGISATFILVLCRLMQGFCCGGELSGAIIYLMENNNRKNKKSNKGFISGLLVAACIIGTLFASYIASIVTNPDYNHNSWRIAYLLGGIIGIIGFFIRNKLSENEVILNTIKQNKMNPILIIFTKYKSTFFKLFLISGFIGVMFYTSFSYINLYLRNHHNWSLSQSLKLSTFGMLIFAFICPFSGKLADTFNIRKIMVTASIYTLIIVPFSFYLLADLENIYTPFLAQALIASAAAFFQGPANLFFTKLFPVEIRYSAIGISYSCGIAIFGGTTPLLLSYLYNIRSDNLYCILYLIFITILAFIMTYTLKLIDVERIPNPSF